MMADPPRHNPLVSLATGYWAESRRPLAGLVFITPLLLTYEAGVLLLGVRNGADLWMRKLLDLMGFGQHLLLPILTVLILLGWHHTTGRPWRLSRQTPFGMAIESALFAVCLRVIFQLQGSLLQAVAGPTGHLWREAGVELSVSGTLGGLVGFLGAGIYEELLFRLILLSVLAWGMRRLGAGRSASLVTAVLASSLLFAAAHHVGPYGESLCWFSFLFRSLAGVFFGVLFICRGFGIAAGAHAGYDILVGLWLF